MCIIVFEKPKAEATKETLKNCFHNNDDGAGYAFIDDMERIILNKGFFTFDEYWEAYSADKKTYCDSPFLSHFRISTGGVISTSNCHPFRISNNVVFAHNGTLDISSTAKKSDTHLFANIMSGIHTPERTFGNKAFLFLLDSYFTLNRSKAVFLFMDKCNERSYFICNESDGTWKDNIWYSNTSYSYRKYNYYEHYNYNTNTFPHMGNKKTLNYVITQGHLPVVNEDAAKGELICIK